MELQTIRKINRSGLLAIVITNQPVIYEGDVTWEGLKKSWQIRS